jgi:hypothetical protein
MSTSGASHSFDVRVHPEQSPAAELPPASLRYTVEKDDFIGASNDNVEKDDFIGASNHHSRRYKKWRILLGA